MTEQQMNKFKASVYEPYTEAWKLIKEMRDAEVKDDAFYEECIKKINTFPQKYNNSEISQSIARIIIDALDEIGRIEKQG